MSFLGKIFVVLIIILSVVFMTLAAVVYGTHTNWEQQAKAVTKQLQEKTADFDELKDRFDKDTAELKSKQEEARQQIAKLETERKRLTGRNVQIQAEIDQLTEANREATQAVTAAEQDNLRLSTQNDKLRQEVRENQTAADEAFKRALAATERVNALQGEVEVLAERNAELIADASRMRAILVENGVNPALPFDAVKPRLDGFVSKTKRRDGAVLVEVTIGADDGLQKDHTVEVFRKDKYLGRVTILKTAPRKAVGLVDKRYQEGRIQEGDRVATRLRAG